ncbi:trafficking protein particle complex subunit 2-like protein [Sminthopsis crassicaudata]|uniref:trafficking protein particle complex subunit 2-like protein n=1 Tax=Sminthopsis crassicaudata TaxID=9301 RepID=UPI003D69BB5E
MSGPDNVLKPFQEPYDTSGDSETGHYIHLLYRDAFPREGKMYIWKLRKIRTPPSPYQDGSVNCTVIPKENYPLYIQSIPADYTVHMSLNVVDEKVSAMGKALVDQRELYLGLLYPTEDYKVYGYVTNSKVKFVMVVDSSNTALRDKIHSMFRKLHNSYTYVMCNSFYNPGDHIHSRAFDNMVISMMVQVY